MRRFRVLCAVVVVAWLDVAAACACDGPAAGCASDADCPSSTTCDGRVCVAAAEGEGEGGGSEGEGAAAGEGEGATGEGEGEGTASLCGNGVLDPGEACDSQEHCSDTCGPDDGFRCDVPSNGGKPVCTARFPSGSPAHLAAGVLDDLVPNPADLPVGTGDCAGSDVDTGAAGASEDLCGVVVPAFTIAQGPSEPSLRVYVAAGLVLGGVLRFHGPNAPVVVVFGDAAVEDVDVAGHAAVAGPGTFVGPCPGLGTPGIGSSDAGAGGGGGGNGFGGGNGGSLTNPTAGSGTGGDGGPAWSSASLLGGCAGGRGDRDNEDPGDAQFLALGGGAGGAFQLSVAGALTLTGLIDAGGGGGGGGLSIGNALKGGGGGGGSGGTIVVEAASLSGGGSVNVIGGGGGEGADNTGRDGNPGLDSGAAGGGASAGGDGGAGTGTDGVLGGSGSGSSDDAGGGGGGGGGRATLPQ